MSFPDRLLLADKSAWERARIPAFRDDWAAAMRDERIVTCLPVRYELLFSTRSAGEYDELERRLAALRDLALTASAQRAAAGAMRELAHLGGLHHRLPLPDLLIAAIAQEHAVTVLHHDEHFERLSRVLRFDTHRLRIAD